MYAEETFRADRGRVAHNASFCRRKYGTRKRAYPPELKFVGEFGI